jgi:hypothetical protein
MKFSKEQVLEKIKATLSKNQKISDRSITDVVTNAMSMFPEDSEMELDVFLKGVLPMVASMNNNLNKDQSDFVKDWQEKNPQPKPKEDKKFEAGEEMPSWFKAEIERREKRENEMEDRIAALTSSKKTDELRNSALSKFKESLKAELDRNPKISQRLEKRYTKILSNVIDDDTVDTLVKRLTEEFNDAKDLAGDGYVPGESSPATGDGEDTKSDPAILAGLSKITK